MVGYAEPEGGHSLMTNENGRMTIAAKMTAAICMGVSLRLSSAMKGVTTSAVDGKQQDRQELSDWSIIHCQMSFQ